MSKSKYILAIDQGTSSTKALVFDDKGQAIAKGMAPLQTHYLDQGFVEQDPEAIYQNVVDAVQLCLEQFSAKGFHAEEISGIGISNQRETFVTWDRQGKPLHAAIVWQCKRSVQICDALQKNGLSEKVQQTTGLVIDPYFSATKLIWLYQNDTVIKEGIDRGDVYFGTVDTWLLFKMTKGKVFATDYTNASRTMLFNIHTLQWDASLIEAFGLRGIQLPELKPSSGFFGSTHLEGLFVDEISITAMIGDSHAAAFGEGCFEAGTAKATMGTGCSILMNVGSQPVLSTNGMVTTICWSIEGRVDYALEGVIVSCGATIEWLKNELQLFTESASTEAMATAVPDNGGVYLIPAFSGLGSPHWQMDRKASISGLTFGSSKNHIVRAALESIPYQIKDVIDAMEKDAGLSLKELNADGGITANQFLMQFLTDLLHRPVARIQMPDVSAMGAAFMAGLSAEVYESLDRLHTLCSKTNYYQPIFNELVVNGYKGWQEIIEQEK